MGNRTKGIICARYLLLLALILTSLSFFEASASNYIEWRNFYQEGNMYVIEVFTPQITNLEFFWKPQEAQQGAYALIGTLSRPNEGDLYQIKWDISPLSDGNYTILVRSTEDEIEQNVVVNRAHWELSPVILTYPGWTDAKYIGTIDGSVNSHPSGGTLSFYAQYFQFTKQSEGNFRVSIDYIPDDVLNLIFKELYSHGAKWGTLFYVINDDLLEVRVIFPSLANYRPGPAAPESDPTEPTGPPETQPPQATQDLLDRLAEISQKLDTTLSQNTSLTNEITNLRSQLEEKEEEIENLRYQLRLKDEETQKAQEETKSYLIIYVLGAAAIGGGIVYMAMKQKPQSSHVQRQRTFEHGRLFHQQPSEPQEETIPGIVFLTAQNQNLDPIGLNNLVKKVKQEKPHLSTERALNEVLNNLNDQGEN